MTKKLILMLTVGIIFGLQSANAQKQFEIVTPKADFDVEAAMKMLNTGKSEIKGEALYEERVGLIRRKTGNNYFAPIGTVITLYPVTPYLNEFFELRKKDKKGKRMAAISREVNSFRILTKVYSLKGEFVFKGLAPGKYYVETEIGFSSGIGAAEFSGIAEIKTDGEIATVELKRRF